MSARDKLAEIISDAENCTDEEGSWALPEDVADAVVAAGWRPPVRVIETVEELEAVKFPAILYGSGTCVEGKGRFEDCQFRPVPELVGGEPGLFETLVVLGVGAPLCAWAEDIHLPVKVLWEPEGEA